MAAYNGNLNCIRFLYDNGADISTPNNNGATPGTFQFLFRFMTKIINEFMLLHKEESWIAFDFYMTMVQIYRLQGTMEQHLVSFSFYLVREKDYSCR